MKQTALLICALFSLLSLQAQAPNRFNYQGVARQATGEVMPNRNIGIRANILSDAPDGSIQYSETHTVTTNQLGLFVLSIGGGIVISGDFEDILWDGKDNFLKIEIDPNGGNDYSFNGTTQLLSVPYAIHSQNASEIGGNAVSATIPTDGQVLKWDDNANQWVPADGSQNIAYTAGAGIAIDAGNTIINTSPDQPISMIGGGATNVTGTYPNFTIETPAPIDNSNTNEIQTLSLNGDTLNLSLGGGSVQLPAVTPVAGSGISIAGNVITNTGDLNPNDDLTNTSNAGGDVTGTFNNLTVTRLQNNPISNITPLNDAVLKWNGASWVPQPDENTIYTAGPGISINGDLISNTGDLDADPSNELQTLSLNEQTLTISNGNSVGLHWKRCGNFMVLDSGITNVNFGLDCGFNNIYPTSLRVGGIIECYGSYQLLKGNNGATFDLTNNDQSNIARLNYDMLNQRLSLSILGSNSPAIHLLNSNGNIGIGTMNPNSKLHVDGGMRVENYCKIGGSGVFEVDAVGITGGRFKIDAGGNVGIGTNSPDTKLTVNGAIKAAQTLIVDNAGTNSGTAPDITLGSASGEGIGSQRTTGTNQWGLDFYTNFTRKMVILNGGNVGIGTSSPAFKLEVNGTAAKPGGGSWTATSDIRLKQNIRPYADGLNTLLRINPVTYHYNEKSGYNTDAEHIGVIAQELQHITPYMVTESPIKAEDGSSYLTVDNSAMTYMLINAIKEQQEMIDHLNKENAALIAKTDKLEQIEAELLEIKAMLRERNK